jgi:hypothetical protein
MQIDPSPRRNHNLDSQSNVKPPLPDTEAFHNFIREIRSALFSVDGNIDLPSISRATKQLLNLAQKKSYRQQVTTDESAHLLDLSNTDLSHSQILTTDMRTLQIGVQSIFTEIHAIFKKIEYASDVKRSRHNYVKKLAQYVAGKNMAEDQNFLAYAGIAFVISYSSKIYSYTKMPFSNSNDPYNQLTINELQTIVKETLPETTYSELFDINSVGSKLSLSLETNLYKRHYNFFQNAYCIWSFYPPTNSFLNEIDTQIKTAMITNIKRECCDLLTSKPGMKGIKTRQIISHSTQFLLMAFGQSLLGISPEETVQHKEHPFYKLYSLLQKDFYDITIDLLYKSDNSKHFFIKLFHHILDTQTPSQSISTILDIQKYVGIDRHFFYLDPANCDQNLQTQMMIKLARNVAAIQPKTI